MSIMWQSLDLHQKAQEEYVNDVDGDLSQWEYLTKMYDRWDCVDGDRYADVTIVSDIKTIRGNDKERTHLSSKGSEKPLSMLEESWAVPGASVDSYGLSSLRSISESYHQSVMVTSTSKPRYPPPNLGPRSSDFFSKDSGTYEVSSFGTTLLFPKPFTMTNMETIDNVDHGYQSHDINAYNRFCFPIDSGCFQSDIGTLGDHRLSHSLEIGSTDRCDIKNNQRVWAPKYTKLPVLTDTLNVQPISLPEHMVKQPKILAVSESLSKPRKMCLPLSAYNYFYRNERDNIVCGMKGPGDSLPPPDHNFSQSKREELLNQHW